MAFFNKPDQQTNFQANATIIASNTVVEGTINSKCGIHMAGAHQGIVNARDAVVIGPTGSIKGKVNANKLTVTGLFEGTVDCENVEILAGGTLRGKVISNNLTIDQACTFEGESVKKPPVGEAQEALNRKAQRPGTIKAS